MDDDPVIRLHASELLDVVEALQEVLAVLPDATPRDRVEAIAAHVLLIVGGAMGRAPQTLVG